MNRKETLNTAAKMVCGHREHDYGSPEDSFTEISKLWTAYKDVQFTPHDVSVMMALLKIARIKNGSAVEDSYVDGCGYLACAAEIATEKSPTDSKASKPKAPRTEIMAEIMSGGSRFIRFSSHNREWLTNACDAVRRIFNTTHYISARDVFTLMGVSTMIGVDSYGWVSGLEHLSVDQGFSGRWSVEFPAPVCLDSANED